MRLLLVNPNRMKPAVAPIALDYLADSVLAAGHEPRLLDLCFATDPHAQAQTALLEFQPGLVGVTVRNTDDCYFTGQAFFLPEIQRLISALRQASNAPIVLGGVGFSIAPKAILEYCGADFGIAGEGEVALVELLNTLRDGASLDRVPNLIYRAGTALHRNRTDLIDLTALPPRRRSFIDNATYFQRGGQAGFETKRGCPMQCIYCAEPAAKGHQIRLHPPRRVVQELDALRALGIDHFHTCDSEFNLPRDHCIDVCRALIDSRLNEKIRWYAYAAPLPFDDSMASLFKRAGCAGIDFGADSGCDEILRRLKRHFRCEDLVRTARSCRKHGIPFMFDLLLGGPGETRQTLEQTVTFVQNLDPDCVGLSIGVRLYPGTPLAAHVRSAPPFTTPRLYGETRDNPEFLKPVFYIAPALGENIVALVRDLVGQDPRFFLPEPTEANANYNYNDNSQLIQAIEKGARGAYWDILRRSTNPA